MLKEVKSFAHFEELVQKWGFRRISPEEAREEFLRAGKRPRRPQEGREVGFEYKAINGLTVVVWTTYLEEKGEFRKKGTDVGWVLIKQNNKAAHFSRPALRRSESFLLNLYRRVVINWYRAAKRPVCPECLEYMNIVRGRRQLKQRYWSCERRKQHPTGKKHTLNFNVALPPAAQKYVAAEYKRRKKYNAKVKEAGGQPYAAMLKRKKWLPAKPEVSQN